ncbi:MAG TPA: ParB/RepB/Spo0J family partition protein [Pyrinomonadaceae bacterium]|nr:ParB/RepB/Spo0J family partition protein [Pyrinomonadaceae bacterium]
MARQPLGRGISALLGDTKPPTEITGTNEIDIDLIEPNPQQPRTRFGETDLEELASSIRANGVVQPIVVRPHGGRYQIVAGERRWRAAQRAGLRRLPAVIKDIPDDKLLELALVENIQRQELNPIEEAEAYRKLIEHIGLTQEQVAERVGKERTLITTVMRLLKLPNDVQRHIVEGKLSLSHGRALLMTDDHRVQRIVANQAVDEDLSVRETERAIKRGDKTIEKANAQRKSIVTKDANVRAAETRLMRHFTTSVKIMPNTKKPGGKIEIEYYGNDDLERLFELLIK